MTLLFSHLNDPTSLLIERPLMERLLWVREDHFVYYPKAQACLDQLSWIFGGNDDRGRFWSRQNVNS
jgi:hypothetical protein